MEQSLVILKPDTLQRGLAGQVLSRFENKGLKIVGMKLTRLTRELAEKHYSEHRAKEFFEDVVGYITSGPVILMVLEGPSAITVIRQMLGPTDGRKAPAGTIRGDFGIATRYNLVHASDSPEAALREIALFFRADELLCYDRDVNKWIWQV
ncbi:MAG: nucleoside-diphosphate kinase [Phycisphaerae bacterium]|nr:nucleoside-diphosphate kinase [Phycisphaerae bacterium]